MAAAEKMTKEDILAQLKKEGVQDLNGMADFILKKARGGNPNGPITNSVIIYSHGFVTH